MSKERSTTRNAAKIHFSIAILMYCVATIHMGVNLYRLPKGYVLLEGYVGIAEYYADPTRWDNMASNVLLYLMGLIGDLLAIYRCFIVWNRNYYIIAVPSIVVLTNITVTVAVFCWARKQSTLLYGVHRQISLTLYPLAFAQNTLTTGSIAFRIYMQHRASSASGAYDTGSPLSLMSIVRIFVESAILYPAELLMLIVLFSINHNAQYIVQAAVTPSIGIVFNLIAVRVHLTRSNAMPINVLDETMPVYLNSTTSPIRSNVQSDKARLSKLKPLPSIFIF